jgi:hypothetical protein
MISRLRVELPLANQLYWARHTHWMNCFCNFNRMHTRFKCAQPVCVDRH